jgi:phenol/toluene 2-monooxygenase (NADH) P1/A1
MSVEIKTARIEPVRQNFGRVARRFGADTPVSRYQEASFDLQPAANFHYRPLWDPQRELYDASRTAVVMADWDSLKDPRQFYYGSYVIQRSRLQEAAEKNFEFVEKNQLVAAWSDELRQRARHLLPLRHLEWAANQANCFVTAYGFGSALTQATMFQTMDRLAMAQYLSRIGLLMDSNTGDALHQAKADWMDLPAWQGLRRLAEGLMAEKDWFRVWLTQNLVLDALVHPVAYERSLWLAESSGGVSLVMLLDFMSTWMAETQKWVDSVVQTVVRANPTNATLLNDWVAQARVTTLGALAPVAQALHGPELGTQRLAAADQALNKRLTPLGLQALSV